jgi:hypothetical protein
MAKTETGTFVSREALTQRSAATVEDQSEMKAKVPDSQRCYRVNDEGTRCEKSLDTTGSPRWCKSCRAQYQQDYQKVRKDMADGKSFAAGVDAMRRKLTRQFMSLGNGKFTGIQCAGFVRDTTAPSNE